MRDSRGRCLAAWACVVRKARIAHTAPMATMLTRIRRTARFAKDTTLIYAGYKRTQRRVRTMSAPDRDAAYEAQHDRAARRLYHLAIDLKGLNIKTGQFIGTRADLAPPPSSVSQAGPPAGL